MPPKKSFKLLDIGCGEDRNAIFFARNGYNVTAFDLAKSGVEKTIKLANSLGLKVNAFQANINEYRLNEKYDILFSTGSLHYIPKELRADISSNYREFTSEDGIHMFSVFVKKPFIEAAPEKEKNSHEWLSGELFIYYNDWEIEYCIEEIINCNSNGIPHKHAMNRILAKKIKIG